MVRETRHLWVGNLPENVREEKIIEHFKRYGRVESVKVLPKRGSEGGVAAFVDFVDIKSAQKAHNAINKMGDRDLRTDYNEPGTIPSAARGLDDSLSLGSRARDVSGFTRAAGGQVYVPPASLHNRDGRYERRLDGTGESRERAYDHGTYGHHDRAGSGSFERQRHYEADYYRDARDRTLGTSGASGSLTPSGSPRYESGRARESFTLASVVHRDLYRDDRGRHVERTYRQSRSRSRSAHSRNPSPERLAGQTAGLAGQTTVLAGQTLGSRSRSSSSDSMSSDSSSTSGSDSSTSSSDDSPARSVQSAAVPAPSALALSSLDKDEPRKSFGIKVQNLPVRSTDTSLKDGLFHEFKKHGKVTSVQIHGASEERYGLVFFRQQEDQEKAQGASKGKLFFGMQIEVVAWNGPETESENEFRPLDERIDEFHPKATRTLFIGNLEKTTSYHDLLNIFQRFGEIVDIDIKKVNGAPQYAFLQYCDIASVCKAIKKMDGEYLGSNRLKLGFGKSMPTTCVWLDGLASNTTEQFLTRHFCRYGHVAKVVFDRMKGMALILYNNIEYAQAAVKEAKGWKIGGNKVKVDFANQESQMAFYRSMQASGQDIRDFYDLLTDRRDERRSQYEFSAERTYYDNVRTSTTYTEDPRRKYPTRSREFYGEWDPYQGDYYDPQYFEDPREYREYRADPYEQDIRKYSYLQRERERERERFETDHGRDHGRRTIERSQSPAHIPPHRLASPTASPSLSERIQSDSERRLCCRSSERSGSCSSVSPPRFEKPDKTHAERYNKLDKLEKDRTFDVERGNVSDKEKRVGRKDKVDKQMLKKLKASSPNSQEVEPEVERDVCPVAAFQSKSIKTQKEACGKVKVDILPCVVQLTRVKESKEGKTIGHAAPEKRRPKGESDSHPLASPSEEQRSPSCTTEFSKGDIPKLGKVEKKTLSSVIDVVEKDAKLKTKKLGKSEAGFDSLSVDIDRLAARKRRFEDSVGKPNRQKRHAEKEDNRQETCLVGDSSQELIDEKSLVLKRIHKRDHSKDNCEHIVSVYSPKDRKDSETNSIGLTLELQSRLGSLHEYSMDSLEKSYVQMECGLSKGQSSSILTKLFDDSNSDAEYKEQKPGSLETADSIVQYKETTECNKDLVSHFEQMKRCKKQTESSSWLGPKVVKPDTFAKSQSPPCNEAYDFEKDCMPCDLRKSDLNEGNVSSSKRKKLEQSDTEVFSPESEPNICSPPHLHEAVQQNITSLSASQVSTREEEGGAQISLSFIKKEQRSSPIADEKTFPHIESLKYNLDLTTRDFQSTDTEFSKLKSALLGCDKELLHRWERKIKSDSVRMEMTSPTSIVKHDTIHANLAEVQSDSDEYSEGKNDLPSTNASLSYILREREDKCPDHKLSGSLEKNKFYSFALDKTITPDTKALLERAKTLYSSREENWSFLPTCFPSTDSCSDKEKVELAPRPIPSWYMKKKKIRTNSEGKLCDKKDELKPQEQERKELFASRFLHSSIFEQDSLRLQRLERKDQDIQTGASKPLAKLSTTELQPVSGSVNIPQEPKVLFHSRFLELQQQKDKDHPAHDAENVPIEIKAELPNGNNDLCVIASDQVHKMNTESVHSVEEKVTLSNTKLKIGSGGDHKTPTSGSSLSSFDGETPEFRLTESITTEPKTGDEESKQCKESEADKYLSSQPLESDIKLLPKRKQPKNKRARAAGSGLRSKRISQIPPSKKPVTRKSERIDKEKLKRASSPLEISKTSEGKNTPIQASDLEQTLDSSLVQGRTRRRNVKSVYATLNEGEQAGKEVIEPLRSMRKRGSDKDQVQQDGPNQSVITRRGRPPKRGGRQGEEVSPVKEDHSTSLEILKTSEEWCSPVTQKVQQPQVKKASKIGRVHLVAEESDSASNELLETKLEEDSVLSGKLSEKEEARKKDFDVHTTSEEEMIRVDVTPSQIKPPEKITKIKTARLKRNAKQLTDEKSHNLKNLEIRVSVDDVKCLLRSEENESVSFEAATITKTIPGLEDNKGTKSVSPQKETKENSSVEMEDLSETETPIDPSANLIARQMELEQAVQNIAKFSTGQQSQPLKEPPAETPSLPPTPLEPPNEVEVEKKALPACETELAAAIDSITSEDISAEPEGFTAPPRYTDVISTVISPATNEIRKPVKRLAFNKNLTADQAVAPLTPAAKPVLSEMKAGPSTAASPEVSKIQATETVKKMGKVKTKTVKKPRSRKGVAIKINKTSKEVIETEASHSKLPESIPEDHQTTNPKAVPAASTAGASVVTALATCRQDISSAMKVDTPKEAEQPVMEQPVPQESAFHLGTNKASSSRKCVQAAKQPDLTIAPSPAPPIPLSQFIAPPLHHGKSITPDWLPKSEGSKMFGPHSPHAAVVTLSEQAVTSLAGPQGNPALPPDTKASDTDPSSSTLRKILMEPKYVSALKNKDMPNTSLTSVLSEPSPRMEKKNSLETVDSRHVHPEEPHHLSPQPQYPKPSPLTESRQNYGEKIQHTVISSPSTSVISRIPIPYDSEDTPRISLSNRNTGQSLPKQKFRTNSNENSRYHVLDTMNDVPRGRSVVENTPYSTAASQGLRVNTSEGVVVLSYSGQKTEGPQRLRAKISPIPPASAGDIEFQQSVSKSHIKQEPIPPSCQPSTPKGPPTPTIYGHTRGLLSGQSYNSQPVIASTKQENQRPEKYEVPYPTGSQGGVVKMFQPSGASSQVLMYNQAVIQSHGHTHGNRGPGTESAPKKMDMSRPAPHSNLSPRMSPHHTSLSSTCRSPGSGIPPDRPAPLMKQEPQSPRSIVKSPSPFVKACPPSSSPIGTSALGPCLSPLSPYSGMPHAHTEQSSVIMPPHNVANSMANEARLNTQPISAINYGRRSDSLPSPRTLPPHHPSTPKSSVIRDMALQSHLGPQGVVSGGINSSGSEEDRRHFNQGLPRPPVPQIQPDVIMMKNDQRSLRLDQYRDMHQRILLHQELGEQAAVDARQARPSELSTISPVSISVHSENELGLRGKVSHSVIAGSLGGMDSTSEGSHLRHGSSVDLSHASRMQREAVSPSYQSPMALPAGMPHKADSSLQGPPAFLTTPPPTGLSIGAQRLHPEGKLEHSGHCSTDMVQLLKKYPIVWQGLLALKNDQAAVQLHFVSGNEVLAQCSLPPPEGGSMLRIVQRMRLEASQLDSVARRMTVENDYCLLLALPCGRDQEDVLSQTQALKTGFITYLQAKQAAGIINVPNPGSNQPAFVVQIFPPCEFSEVHLSHLAPDLLNSISSISPHLMIVIASV
uniref:Spen family transcriptional repressor n=1 Tax=Gadus morhua TaxID=8049 RepID=A0A8C5FKP6_GADMO